MRRDVHAVSDMYGMPDQGNGRLAAVEKSVPNLTRRYASRLSSEGAVRRDYQRLERELDNRPSIREVSEKN